MRDYSPSNHKTEFHLLPFSLYTGVVFEVDGWLLGWMDGFALVYVTMGDSKSRTHLIGHSGPTDVATTVKTATGDLIKR